MDKGLALETKMNSFLVCKMNLWRFEMHSKLYIYIYPRNLKESIYLVGDGDKDKDLTNSSNIKYS
jgi:hypothetical protein